MSGRRVLVTGGEGRMARALVPALQARGWDVTAPDRSELDVTDPDAVAAALDGVGPEVVVNLAALTDQGRCEREPERAEAVNARAVATLAEAAAPRRAHLVQMSTDFVLDGAPGRPCREDDPLRPLSAYARSKAAGEVAAGPTATIVRTAWLAAPSGPGLVAALLARAGSDAGALTVVDDQWGSPTSSLDAAPVLARLVEERPAGVVHLANAGVATRADVARLVLEVAGHDPSRVVGLPAAEWTDPDGVVRPTWSVLATDRLEEMGLGPLRPWEGALAEVVRARLG